MKYCPLCAAEYREGHDTCSSCAAALVPSLAAEEVRKNPPVLLWIGGGPAEFDALAGALRQANVPALAEEGPLGILQRFLRSESRICVLQHDLARALAVAAGVISLRAAGVNTQICHQCQAECSAALAVCPNCATVLILGRPPKAQPSSKEEPPVLPASKYCPLCDTEYGANYSQCTICGVALVPEELRGRPFGDQDLKEKLFIIWRGGDPVAVSNVVSLLRQAGIRHHVESTHDHFVFELAMPRPRYVVRILESDVEKAKDLLDGITDSPFFGGEISPDFPKDVAPRANQAPLRWNLAAATVEIWKGDDPAMGKLLEDCLRENKIGFRREGRGPGQLCLFVTTQDELQAREILREVRDGAPPA